MTGCSEPSLGGQGNINSAGQACPNPAHYKERYGPQPFLQVTSKPWNVLPDECVFVQLGLWALTMASLGLEISLSLL